MFTFGANHGSNAGKRSRVEEDESRSARTWPAWARIVTKLLMALFHVTELTVKLLIPERESEVLPTQRRAPFSVWPTNPSTIPEDMESQSEITESYQMVDASENEAPSEVSFTSSMGNAAQDYLTEEELKFLGAPPLCFHQRPCILFATRKEGANLGRIFWRCPMARGQQCKAFVWTEYQPTWQELKDRRSQPPSCRSQTSTAGSESQPGAPSTAGTDCKHKRVCKSGTNAYVIKEKCMDCGMVLVDRKKTIEETQARTKEVQNQLKKVAPNEALKKPNDQQSANPTARSSTLSEAEMADFEDFQKYLAWKKQQPGRRSPSE